MQFAPNFVTRKRFAQGLWGLLGSGAARQTHGARARTQGEGKGDLAKPRPCGPRRGALGLGACVGGAGGICGAL